jgi:hypothetical protein
MDKRGGHLRSIRLENEKRREINERIKPNGDECQGDKIKKSLSYFV